MPAWNDYKSQAKDRGALALELFVVHTTSAGDPEALKNNLPDHLAYQRDMELAGNLVMAGPISDPTGNEMFGSGMIVYRAETMEAAKALADADPMHSSGARTYTLNKWLVNEGNLSITVGLSTGTASLS